MSRSTESSLEVEVGMAVSEVSLWGIGRELGNPHLHDDNSEDSMYDLRFSSTSPPVAMEVTAIVDGQFRATGRAAQRIVDSHLQEVAEQSGNTRHWFFSITSGTVLKQLRPHLEDRMRTGDASEEDLLPGLLSVRIEVRDEPGTTIVTWSDPSAGSLPDIYEELVEAIESNRAKLAAADGYERHLAVDVQAMRASDPGRTPTPALPPDIDVLWVLRRAYSPMRGMPVVWVTTGDRSWKVNGEPHDAM